MFHRRYTGVFLFCFVSFYWHTKSVIEGGNYPGAVLKELGHFHALLYFPFAQFWLQANKEIRKEEQKEKLFLLLPFILFPSPPLKKKIAAVKVQHHKSKKTPIFRRSLQSLDKKIGS